MPGRGAWSGSGPGSRRRNSRARQAPGVDGKRPRELRAPRRAAGRMERLASPSSDAVCGWRERWRQSCASPGGAQPAGVSSGKDAPEVSRANCRRGLLIRPGRAIAHPRSPPQRPSPRRPRRAPETQLLRHGSDQRRRHGRRADVAQLTRPATQFAAN